MPGLLYRYTLSYQDDGIKFLYIIAISNLFFSLTYLNILLFSYFFLIYPSIWFFVKYWENFTKHRNRINCRFSLEDGIWHSNFSLWLLYYGSCLYMYVCMRDVVKVDVTRIESQGRNLEIGRQAISAKYVCLQDLVSILSKSKTRQKVASHITAASNFFPFVNFSLIGNNRKKARN